MGIPWSTVIAQDASELEKRVLFRLSVQLLFGQATRVVFRRHLLANADCFLSEGPLSSTDLRGYLYSRVLALSAF
jgi:hypothetical protein